MKKSITAAASGVMVFVTVTAECSILVTVTVFSPNSLSAPIAGCRITFIAFSADYLAIDLFIVFILADKRSAVRAIQRVLLVIFHCKNLHK